MEDFLKKAGDVLISSGLKLLLACLILIIGFKLVKFLLAIECSWRQRAM